MDFVCKLVGSDAPAKIKEIFVIDNLPVLPLIMTSIVAYLFFGPAADQLKVFLDSFMTTKVRELTHSQKVEDGYKII